MDLPIPILPDPQRPSGPGQPRIAAAAGRWDGGEHMAGLWIDLMDAILGDLKEVLSVECCSCMGGDIDRALHLSARRIESVQLVSRSKPDVLAVIANSVHAVSSREGTILSDDFSV